MDVFGYISRNASFCVKQNATNAYAIVSDHPTASSTGGFAIVDTGLILHPPTGMVPFIRTPSRLLREGLKIEATWEAGSPLVICITSVRDKSWTVDRESVIAHVTLVKVASPRLAKWTEETLAEAPAARSELEKMTLPPKPISIMGALRRLEK